MPSLKMYLIVACIRVTFLNVFASLIRIPHNSFPGVPPSLVVISIFNAIYGTYIMAVTKNSSNNVTVSGCFNA